MAKGKGIPLIDTTVRSGEKAFAPTWEMVKGIKEHTLSEEEYTKQYIFLMRKSMVDNRDKWLALLEKPEFAIACYCGPNDFCHRFVLKDILLKLAKQKNIEIEYCGEIT